MEYKYKIKLCIYFNKKILVGSYNAIDEFLYGMSILILLKNKENSCVSRLGNDKRIGVY